jgi:hypothetical protein
MAAMNEFHCEFENLSTDVLMASLLFVGAALRREAEVTIPLRHQ